MKLFRDDDGKKNEKDKGSHRVFICPQCQGTNVEYGLSDAFLTYSYECHDCGYQGMVAIEKDVNIDEEEEVVEASLPED
jgi:predicted RNA-binding Zn-ribbon protein involved in translation (DUF1610 family)